MKQKPSSRRRRSSAKSIMRCVTQRRVQVKSLVILQGPHRFLPNPALHILRASVR
jgi:hypothetical protein